MARVAGVDGCRGGWVVAGGDGSLAVVTRLDDVVAGWDVVAVDIPIGLPDAGPRPCDLAARRLLGPRRSSVFPAPERRFLGAASFPEVERMSLQTFHLVGRIAEVDALVTPSAQDRVAEAHPELAFARLAGDVPLSQSKRTPAGRAARARLLGLDEVPRLPGAATDDVLDAMVLVLTAGHVAAGTGRRLGGERDGRGLRMEIWS